MTTTEIDHETELDLVRVLRDQLQRAQHDLRTVAEAIHEEAVRRDWCDEYDEFASRVNSDCHGDPLPKRLKEYEEIFSVTTEFKSGTDFRDVSQQVKQAIRDVLDNNDAEEVTVTTSNY